MIRSMTGFGEASEQRDGVHHSVEVRSLNNRYFKATIRLPDILAGLEAELETLLRQRLNRGSITAVVKMRTGEGGRAQKINDTALMAYLDHLETIHSKIAEKDQSVHIDLTALLALPGVLANDDEIEVVERARPIILRLAEQACERLGAMRVREGKSISDDLNKQRALIMSRLESIRERAPHVVEEYHQRLRARIDDLLKRAELKVDEKDLIREVAIFAERVDISEEVTRLSEHLKQFERITTGADSEPAGRTLDFLSQELLREANTIASKSNDAPISRTIVEVKGAIDRIKEQVQNVE